MPDNYSSVLRLRSLYRSFAREAKVYPTLASGVTITAAASAWVAGNVAEIVPASTITECFRIDYLSFAAFSAAVTYEVIVYKGAAGSEEEIGRVRIHPGTTSGVVLNVPLFTKMIDANERISAKVATGTGVANTVVMSISYHEDAE